MLLEELLKDEREVGRKEGLEQGRSEGFLREWQKVYKCSCLNSECCRKNFRKKSAKRMMKKYCKIG